ncbi:MAG: hypothetical protein H6Q41_5877 [Deltaproteobacteria bacterium]|nr:hypothetical protein [Deltaproteobacteria bacterium]
MGAKEIREGVGKWEKNTLRRTLEASGERKEEFFTESGIPVKRLREGSIRACIGDASGP